MELESEAPSSRLQSDQRGAKKANKELHYHCTHSFKCDLLVFDLPLRAVDLSRNRRSSLGDNCTSKAAGMKIKQIKRSSLTQRRLRLRTRRRESPDRSIFINVPIILNCCVCRAAWRQLNSINSPTPLHFQLLSHTSASPLQLRRSSGRRGANLRNFRRSFGTDLENNFSGPCSGSQRNGVGFTV